MADWRQIQARIRKAKASTTPAEHLTELHQRTRDAMVAFELARLYEKNGDNAEAAKWFTTAAQQFRRAQWRVKAEEALSRLGAEIPPHAIGADRTEAIEESAASDQPVPAESEAVIQEIPEEVTEAAEPAAESATATDASPAAEESTPAGVKRRHRRGRRGGRKHRRPGAPGQPVTDAQNPTSSERPGRERTPMLTAHSSPAPQRSSGTPAQSGYRPAAREVPPRDTPELEPIVEAGYDRAEPASIAVAGRARAAEPALSSRMAQLESRLRRLLACALAPLKDAEQAPAGPGVLLLSDSDQVTHYYVESCHTLRIGIANLLRGGRGSKEAGRLKPVMAENLGISESRVAKYMNDHCVVRWLQLDEGAPELAHFAIAVLHPVVNE